MQVTLYTKPGCHLCEAVEQVIARVRRTIDFDFVKRNILDDPTDLQSYGHLIPVVTLDGREIARHRMTESQLRAALQAKSSGV
jgi:glutaredoxin